MTTHATTRSDYAIRRLVGWLQGLTLTGSPVVSDADEGRGSEAGPWVRVTFDELPGTHSGNISSTQSVIELGLLVTCDVLWPHRLNTTATSIRPHVAVADELRAAMQFLSLDFYDYTVPAAPVTVTDAPIVIQRVDVRRLPDDDGYRRRQVRGYARWYGRFDDHFA